MNELHYQQERHYWDSIGENAKYVSLSEYDQKRLNEWINWIGKGVILDIGGGSGIISSMLMKSDSTQCITLDISYNMLKHSPTTCVQADAIKLPFTDNSIDLIIAAAFLHHIPQKEKEFIEECWRVLKKEGRIIGYDPNGKCLQNIVFMGENTVFRLSLFSPDERPIDPALLKLQFEYFGFKSFNYKTFSFFNSKMTLFEWIQRFIINPLAKGMLKERLDRWFYWEAYKDQ